MAEARAAKDGPHANDSPQFNLFLDLQKIKNAATSKSTTSFWQRLTPTYMVGTQGIGRCCLKCDLCSEQLTSNNPSQTAGNHLGKDGREGGCKELMLTEREATQQGVQLCPIAARLNFWASPAATSDFPALDSVAMRLLIMHTTS
jgi:hypothetical protein